MNAEDIAKKVMQAMGYKIYSTNYQDIPASFSYLNGSTLLEIFIKVNNEISETAALEFAKMIKYIDSLALKYFMDQFYKLERNYWCSYTTDEESIEDVINFYFSDFESIDPENILTMIDDTIAIKYDFFSKLNDYNKELQKK